MRQLLAAVAMVVLVAIAGCSSQPQVITAPAGSPVAPPTTVKPKALSRAAAAKRYLEVVRPYNLALERLEQAFNAGGAEVRRHRPVRPRAPGDVCQHQARTHGRNWQRHYTWAWAGRLGVYRLSGRMRPGTAHAVR